MRHANPRPLAVIRNRRLDNVALSDPLVQFSSVQVKSSHLPSSEQLDVPADAVVGD